MRTFSLVKGQPVFETKSGTKIGKVCDLCITKDGKVRGLLVKKDDFFRQTYVLDIGKVASFGSDGVMIADVKDLEKLKDSPDHTMSHQNALDGMLMLTKSGESLGLLKDVYFQEELGTIIGYEITDGFFSDITEGKQVIQSGSPLSIGKDAIIVDIKHT